MKQINVYFDDKEHEKLIKEKNGSTWHDFILKLIETKTNEETKKQ